MMSYHEVEDNFRELERRLHKIEHERNASNVIKPVKFDRDFQKLQEDVDDLTDLLISLGAQIKWMKAAIEELSLGS